jgi:hypothetical protein
MSDSTVDVGRTAATGWPLIEDASKYTGIPATDDILIWALESAVDYGSLTLGERYGGPVTGSVFQACLDYAGSVYTERIGQSDISVEQFLGSTPLTRYRRILLANRYTAIA